MPYKIEFMEEHGIVVIENKGEVSYEELVKQSQEAIELVQCKKARLLLTDFSSVDTQASITDIFQFPKIYNGLGLDRTSRIAVLVSDETLGSKELSFYETICLNRGWQVRIFTKKDLALEWLVNTQ